MNEKVQTMALDPYDKQQEWLKMELAPNATSAISAFFDTKSRLVYANYYVHEPHRVSGNSGVDPFELYYIYALQSLWLKPNDYPEELPAGTVWVSEQLTKIIDGSRRKEGKGSLRLGLPSSGRGILSVRLGHLESASKETFYETVVPLPTFPNSSPKGPLPEGSIFWRASRYHEYKEEAPLLHITLAWETSTQVPKNLKEIHQESESALEKVRDELFSDTDRYIARFIQTALGRKVCGQFLQQDLAKSASLEHAFLAALFSGHFHDFTARQIIRHIKLRRPEVFDQFKNLALDDENETNSGSAFQKAPYSSMAGFVSEMVSATEEELGALMRPDILTENVTFAGVSPRGGVGKSTSMFSLAIYFAQRGEKTAFLELDISNPNLCFLDPALNLWAQDRIEETRSQLASADPVTNLLRAWGRGRQEALSEALSKWLYPVPGFEQGRGLYLLHARTFEEGTSAEVSERLSGLRTTRRDGLFIDHMISILRKRHGITKIVIDTAAGLNMLTAGVLEATQVDCCFFIALPMRLGLAPILQQVGPEVGARGKKHILVNQMDGECDQGLFGNPWAIYDEAAHWANSGDSGPIRRDQLNRLRALLFASGAPMSVYSFDTIPRLRASESIGDWIEIVKNHESEIWEGFKPGYYKGYERFELQP